MILIINQLHSRYKLMDVVQLVVIIVIGLFATTYVNCDPVEGDQCTLVTDCNDTFTFLHCDLSSSTCACDDEATTYFEPFDGKCHLFENEPCSNVPCTFHGHCDNGHCTCDESYSSHTSGRCWKAYGTSCTDSTDCSPINYMECLEPNLCLCDETNSFFDDDEFYYCGLKANQPCETLSPHPISMDAIVQGPQKCDRGSLCSDVGDGSFQCECKPNLLVNGNGVCRAKALDPCSKTEPCDVLMFLTCISDICNCQPPLEMAGSACRTPFGLTCGANIAPCDETKFLICNSTNSLCGCEADRIDLGQGQCRTPFGLTCGDELAPCDETVFLECNSTDSLCGCDVDLVDLGQGQCRAPLHISCDPIPCDETNFLICETSTKTCVCSPGMSPDWMGYCRAMIDEPCSAEVICGNFTICIDDGGTSNCKCLTQYTPASDKLNCEFTLPCPGFICADYEFCDESTSFCLNKLELGQPCQGDSACGDFAYCSESRKICTCLRQYEDDGGKVNCTIFLPCSSDYVCTVEEYCEQDGFCQPKKSISNSCNSSIECRGDNIVCKGQGNDVENKVCQCTSNYEPDKDVSDPTATCIEIPKETPENPFCKQTDVYGQLWKGYPGQLVSTPCPLGQKGLATWVCGLDSQFETDQPNFKNCTTNLVSQMKDKLDLIMNAENGGISMDNATEFMNELNQTLTNGLLDDSEAANGMTTNEFFGHEIQTMVDMAQIVASKVIGLTPEDNPTSGALQKIENVSSQIYTVTGKLLKYKKPWEQLSNMDRTQTFTNILSSVAATGFALVDKVSTGNGIIQDYSRTFDEPSLSTTIVGPNQTFDQFPLNSDRREGEESFIELPDGLLDQPDGTPQSFLGTEMQMDFVKTFISPSVVKQEQDGFSKDDSKTLNANLLGFQLPTNDTRITGTVSEPKSFSGGKEVTTTFLHDADSWGDDAKNISRKLQPGERPRAVKGSTECVQWNEQQRSWTAEGCRLVETSTFYTKCACNRPSNYGIMNQFHQYKGKSLTELIVIFGSFLFSFISQAYKIYQSWDVRVSFQVEMRTYMNGFLIVSNVLLLFFVDRHFFNLSEGWCYFVGFASHLVPLCALMILFVVIFNMYMFPGSKDQKEESSEKINKFKSFVKNNRKLTYLSLCVGVPIFIVGLTAICGAIGGKNSRAYGGDFCWLDGSYIWAFFTPAIIVIVGNLVLIVLVLRTINIELDHLDQHLDNLSEAQLNRIQKLCSRRRSALFNTSYSILLGVTWTVGYFTVGPKYVDSQIVQLGFKGLIGLQFLFGLLTEDDQTMDEVLAKFTKDRTTKAESEPTVTTGVVPTESDA